MNCHEMQERLGDHLDGVLVGADRAAADRHLAGCAACRAERDELRAALAMVHALPRTPAPAAFASDVNQEIRMRSRIAAWADGALAPEDADEVERHVAGCAGCREELQDLRRLGAVLSGMPKVPAPKSLVSSVLSEIRAESAVTAPRGVLLSMSRGALWLRALSAAAAVLAIWVGVSRWPGREKLPETEGHRETAANHPEEPRGNGSAEEGSAKNPKSGYTDAGDPGLVGDRNNNAGGVPDKDREARDKAAIAHLELVQRERAAAEMARESAPPELAVRRVTVYSSNIAVDARAVQELLSESGYTWTAADGDRKVLARVPASRANELLAKLSRSPVGGFRAGQAKDSNELAESKAKLKAQQGAEGDSGKESAGKHKELESALEEHLKDSRKQIAKAKQVRRGEAAGAAAPGQSEEQESGAWTGGGPAAPSAPADAKRADKPDGDSQRGGKPFHPGATEGTTETKKDATGRPAEGNAPGSEPAKGGAFGGGKEEARGDDRAEQEAADCHDGDGGGSEALRKLQSEKLAEDQVAQRVLDELARIPLTDAEEAVVIVIEFTEEVVPGGNPADPAPGK